MTKPHTLTIKLYPRQRGPGGPYVCGYGRTKAEAKRDALRARRSTRKLLDQTKEGGQ